jgi:hypothetical protein
MNIQILVSIQLKVLGGKKNKLQIYAVTWMNLKIVKLNKPNTKDYRL